MCAHTHTRTQIRAEFIDPRAPSNVRKLNNDLNQIHDIMCQNIQEVDSCTSRGKPAAPALLLRHPNPRVPHVVPSRQVLKRGEKLENVQSKVAAAPCLPHSQNTLARHQVFTSTFTRPQSSTLLSESKRFEKQSRYVNMMAMYQQYGPVAGICVVFLIFMYFKFWRS